MSIDYEKVGLRCGIEIHQRLDTHKLFCGCSSDLADDEPVMEVRRKLRAVAGELGEVDRAALHERLRDREFLYLVYEGKSCLVELDEEPPSPMNQEALDIGLQVGLLFHATIPEEVHVMRKTVVDGSNTSGFQRTAMIGLDGWMDGPRGRIEIPTVCLEEEAAGIGGEKDGAVVYKLDRLGIPLVEMATGILEGYTPQQVQEVARRMGMTLRMTGRVQRGIGTIRQDVNVSIRDGARVEIKGFQEIGKLGELVEREVERQISLIKIRKSLKERDAGVEDPRDVTDHFRDLNKGFLARIISENGTVLALRLRGFAGLLGTEICPGRTFGRELADHARAYGLGGIIHSDEDLAKMGLEDCFRAVRNELGAVEKDAVVIMAGKGETLGAAMDAVRERAKTATRGVPEETREPNSDYTTSYKRPLPGSSRMYPETDIPPIPISPERVEVIRASLPEAPDVKIRRFTELGMSEDLARQIVRDGNLPLFERALTETGVDATLAATVLVNSFTNLRRSGVEVDSLDEEELMDFFAELSRGRIVKERMDDVLTEMARGDSKLSEILEGEESLSEDRLREIVESVLDDKSELVNERGEHAFGPVMGLVMGRVRGKIDGAVVGRVVRELLEERL